MATELTTFPVAPLRDSPIFPNTETVLIFGRNRSVEALKAAWGGSKKIFVVMQKDPEKLDPRGDDLYKVGTICLIKHILHTDGEVSALVSGLSRATAQSYQDFDSFSVANVVEIPEVYEESEGTTALANYIISTIQNALRLGKPFDFLAMMRVMSGVLPTELSNIVCPMLDIKALEKQVLLEESNIANRLSKIVELLNKEIKTLEVSRNIAMQAQSKMDKNFRKHILEEQKRAIEEELGEGGEQKETDDLKHKIAKAGMPPEIRKKAEKELKKLLQTGPMNPEKGWIQNYLDWLLDMPWSAASKNNVQIVNAKKVLDEDHFGLEKVKERIIEYLAVMKLKHKKSGKGEKSEASNNNPSNKNQVAPTILCFVGPPGVGKTSIGKSIARALGRKFVRVSLGGIRDEAEIRGHRRTYVGAMPGRIIQGIKQAGTNNPVFMLDEIDKIGNDFRGDPSAALLEALDPEQNYAFSDHYLEVPFDLSGVMFITTANVLDTIPSALQDRLEIIEFPGYTLEEKFSIAKKYLIPKQLEVNGVTQKNIEIADSVLKTVISRYTFEAGVRNLEREIATIIRKVARKVAEGKAKRSENITPAILQKFLGPFRFTSTIAERKDEAGLSTGLFYTPAGGGIHLIEAAIMPGKGNLTLTGHLGDVMQESARAALSYVRSHWKELGLEEKFFQKIDIHVHVPAGATPKEGPSAGAAITTAIASALTRIPTNRYVAMTGEVTLRGRILPIGGVKEKIIGAHLAGIKTVILPKLNKKDLEDIPKYVLKELKFHFVEHMDQVLDITFTKRIGSATSSKIKGKKRKDI